MLLSGESRSHTISSPRKKQMEVVIPYSLTYYSVIVTLSFLQLLQAEHRGTWGPWGEVDWRQEPPLLGGTEEKRLRLLSLTDFNTVPKHKVPWEIQPKAGTSPSAQPCTLIKAHN